MPSGLLGPVAAMSTRVTASAQATETRTRNLVAIVTRAMAGSRTGAPFTHPGREYATTAAVATQSAIRG